MCTQFWSPSCNMVLNTLLFRIPHYLAYLRTSLGWFVFLCFTSLLVISMNIQSCHYFSYGLREKILLTSLSLAVKPHLYSVSNWLVFPPFSFEKFPVASITHTSTKIISCVHVSVFMIHQRPVLSLIVYFLSPASLVWNIISPHRLAHPCVGVALSELWLLSSDHDTALGSLCYHQPSFLVSLAGSLSPFLPTNIGMFQDSILIPLFFFYVYTVSYSDFIRVQGLWIAFLCRQLQNL